MLPRNHPDRIRIVFDDYRLVANAGLPPAGHSRPTSGPGGTRRPSPQSRQRAGPGQHRRQDDDPGGVCPGWRRLHRRRRCAARRWDGRCSRLQGQGAIHLGHFPAQLPLGPRPSTGPGEPGSAGPGLGRWGGTRRRAVHHRPRFHHLRDLRTGQGGCPPPRLYRQAGLSPAAGRGRRHRGRVDVPAARGPGQHCSGRRSLPARDGGDGCATPAPGDNSRCGPTAASMPTPSSPSAAGWMSASPSPSANTKACAISSRRYPRRTGRRFLTGWTAPPMWSRPPTFPLRVRPAPRRCGSSSGG